MTDRIPREFIQQLLHRIEIVDLIDSRVPLKKKSGNNYFACCPFHTEKSASFSVSQNKQFYHCFGCGAHGNAIDFLMQFDRMEFPEAIESLAKQIGLEIPRESRGSTEKTASHASLHELMEEITKYYQTQLRQTPRAVDYLKTRGLSGQIAKDFAIGYAPPGWDHVLQQFGKNGPLKQQLSDVGMLIKKDEGGFYDRFRDRIMFPIHDRRGRIVGFGGRILDKGEPKYLNSPETPIFQKGHELYGLYHALQVNRQLHRALIVEGYMDVIALFQNGINYAVATLGTATTANHLQRLFRYTSEIIFCFDGDQAGRTAAWRALLVTLPVMKDGIQMRFMFLPDGEDPDSLVRKEGKVLFEQRMQNALTIADFFFQTLATQTDLGTTDGRARFVKLASEHLEQLPESIFQQMMFEELAKRTRLSVEQLKPATKPSFKPQPNPQKARSPSALRLGMALLVQHPELAQYLTKPLPKLDLNGYDLFLQLVEHISQHPNLNSATLYEHWRDRREAPLIAKLANLEHMIPDEIGIKNEFLGAIQRFEELERKQIIETMLIKASQTGLTPEEKQQLHAMIQVDS
ncbi:MAG: DNA primase [Gammaproteobacteria bacterium]